MATRRNVSSQQPSQEPLSPDRVSILQPATGKSNTSPAVPGSVIFKLLAFTAAMAVLPLGTYFATVDMVFRGSSTWAGASAALMANVVLIGYVVVAMAEDQTDRIEAEKTERKAQ